MQWDILIYWTLIMWRMFLSRQVIKSCAVITFTTDVGDANLTKLDHKTA